MAEWRLIAFSPQFDKAGWLSEEPPRTFGSSAELVEAAEQGNAVAQSELGWNYFTGDGFPKDADVALSWFRRAAEHGEPSAQNRIGVCFERGLGVARDMAKAAEWYEKAAERGYAQAQDNLGLCYGNGTINRQ